jgi:hypothetical protein
MIPPLTSDRVIYTPEQIRGMTQPVLDIRDCLVAQGQLPHAAAMSVVVLLLNHLADHTNP